MVKPEGEVTFTLDFSFWYLKPGMNIVGQLDIYDVYLRRLYMFVIRTPKSKLILDMLICRALKTVGKNSIYLMSKQRINNSVYIRFSN